MRYVLAEEGGNGERRGAECRHLETRESGIGRREAWGGRFQPSKNGGGAHRQVGIRRPARGFEWMSGVPGKSHRNCGSRRAREQKGGAGASPSKHQSSGPEKAGLGRPKRRLRPVARRQLGPQMGNKADQSGAALALDFSAPDVTGHWQGDSWGGVGGG